MKQIDRIRAMSAEQLANFLMDHCENGNFSVDVCDKRFCKHLAATEEGEDVENCSYNGCLAAAVAYLESETE